MKKSSVILIAVFGLSIIVLIWVLSIFMQQKPSRFMWTKTYKDSKIEPYDFGVFKRLITQRSGKLVEAEDDLSLTLKENEEVTSYLFVGRNCYLRKTEVEQLLSLAVEGKQVVVISEGFPDTLLKALSYGPRLLKTTVINESRVGVKSLHPSPLYDSFSFAYREHQDIGKNLTDWHIIDESEHWMIYGDSGSMPYKRLSTINGYLNAATFKHGKGSVTIHTSPMLLSNLAMQTEQGFLMASELMSGVDLTCVVYDVGSREQKADAAEIRRSSDSPLSYLLAQPAFRWAWYVFLGTVLAFFVFKVKRKQRIIPVIGQKQNTTVDFINVLGALYYQTADYGKMAQTRMQVFLYFVRHKLGIPTQEINEAIIHNIAIRAEVDVSIVQGIFQYYSKLQPTQTSPEQLMELHRRIEQFYQLYHHTKKQDHE